MLNLSRRSLLTGAAAATLAPVTIVPAIAAAPPAEKQNPGVYRYKIGTHQISVVTDGVNRQPLPDTLVTNVKKEDVQAMLAASYLDPSMFFNPYTPVVVNAGSKLIVIDTGNGEDAYNRSKGAFGQFQTNLKAAGIDAKAVDTVIISHYHGDHVNGLLLADNSLAFPNAEILVPAEERKFWMDDSEMSRASKGRMEELFKNNRRVFSSATSASTAHLRVGQGGRARNHRAGDARPLPGPYLVRGGVRQCQGVRADRRHPCPVSVRAQSGLARLLRSGRAAGRDDAPQCLRHARG